MVSRVALHSWESFIQKYGPLDADVVEDLAKGLGDLAQKHGLLADC